VLPEVSEPSVAGCLLGLDQPVVRLSSGSWLVRPVSWALFYKLLDPATVVILDSSTQLSSLDEKSTQASAVMNYRRSREIACIVIFASCRDFEACAPGAEEPETRVRARFRSRLLEQQVTRGPCVCKVQGTISLQNTSSRAHSRYGIVSLAAMFTRTICYALDGSSETIFDIL
jgi:hypothetical protein